MSTITITDEQQARLLALAVKLNPPQTVAEFIETVSRATYGQCP